MAPFVFAGSEYDDGLRRVFTSISDDDVFRRRNPLTLMTGTDSLADTWPLGRLIARYVDADLLAAVAEAHRAGRRLYVGTTAGRVGHGRHRHGRRVRGAGVVS